MSIVAMRVARPTGDLDRIRSFYERVVGLALLWSFADHDGFDGAIFGLPGETAQLELVRSPHGDMPTPTNEDALVLYDADGESNAGLLDRLRRAGTAEITADDPTLNPYWPRHGARVFVDPDGYRLVVSSAEPGSGARGGAR
jgi:catechol 2,3-dioxygenase-like lactoylglutathione lyase family enzyme